MMRTLSTWFIFAAAATALMAGCGGKSTSTSSTGGSSSSTSTPSSSTSTAHAPTGSVSPGPSGTSATGTIAQQQHAIGKHAVASCKSAIQAQTSIPASAKAKLEAICGKAATGSKEALEAVAHEECVALVSATPLPNAAAKQRALAICKAPA